MSNLLFLFYLFVCLLAIKRNTVCTLMSWLYKYATIQWRGRVFIQQCQFSCLASLKASNFLVSQCLQFVAVAVIVHWDGLPVCCDGYWLFHGWHHLRKGCWSLYVEYDLLHIGVHLLWLWEFWIGTFAWRLCCTCWSNPTVLFRSFTSLWLPLCRWVVCFRCIDRIFFLSTTPSLLFLIRFVF